MRTSQTTTISLPPEMLATLDKTRKAEHRTRSELVREALRLYFSRFPVELTSPADRRALERARAEYRRGDYITLDELNHSMARRSREVRAKGARARS